MKYILRALAIILFIFSIAGSIGINNHYSDLKATYGRSFIFGMLAGYLFFIIIGIVKIQLVNATLQTK